MTIPGWTEAELLEAAVFAPRRAFVPMPDTQVIERPGWMQILTPSFKDGGMNEVSQSVLSDDEADAVIDATIDTYRGLGLRFRWCVEPDARPLDLEARLAARGLVPSVVRVMVGETAPPPDAPPALPEGVRVVRVGLGEVEAYSAVMAEGWGMSVGPLLALHRKLLTEHGQRVAQYVAMVDGAPGAVASCMFMERAAFLQGAVVLPPHRGRGLYRALVRARLDEAHARGLRLASTHARIETSAPIMAHLGFEALLDYPKMMYTP